jgi:hypothetical protein
MKMVEAAALLVSIVALLMERLDKREGNLSDRLDIREALISLQRVVNNWHRAALATNRALEIWTAKGKPVDPGSLEDLSEYAISQSGYVGKVKEELEARPSAAHSIQPRRKAAGTRFGDVLAVYVPEMKDQMDSIFALRSEQLERLKSELQNHSPSQSVLQRMLNALAVKEDQVLDLERVGPNDIEAFRQAQAGLERASSDLARFINERFPLGSSESSH